MTPKQLGHRAAAWGVDRNAIEGVPPLPTAIAEARRAYDDVLKAAIVGLDPNRHPPRIPHLCERDISKVCNCCPTCSTACWAEGFEGTSARIFDATRGLLRKFFKR